MAFSPSDIPEKLGKPTIQIATFALGLDIISILYFGKSPAFMDAHTIVNNLPVSLGYITVTFFLVSLFIIVPMMMLSLTINHLAYLFVTWIPRRFREFRVLMKFYKRSNFVDAEKVRHFAKVTRNEELMSRVEKHVRETSAPSMAYPALIFLLLSLLLLVSDENHPNFFMKVCSFNEPVSMCGWYKVVTALAFLQSIFMMAVYGYVSRMATLFPREKLNVSDSELLGYEHRSETADFEEAKNKWLKGK